MATEVQSAFAKFTLYIDEFQQNARIAREELTRLRDLSKEAIVANVRLTGVRRVRASTGGGDPSAATGGTGATTSSAQAHTAAANAAGQHSQAVDELHTKLDAYERAVLQTMQAERQYAQALAFVQDLLDKYQEDSVARQNLLALSARLEERNANAATSSALAMAQAQVNAKDYSAALQTLGTAQQQVGASTQQGMRVQARMSELQRSSARSIDQQVVSQAKADAQAGKHVKALSDIQRRLDALTPGTKQYNDLLQQQNAIATQAMTGQNRITDNYAKQLRTVNDLRGALAVVQRQQGASTNTPTRESELDLQSARLTQEIRKEEVELAKARATLTAQTGNYSDAAAQLQAAINRGNLTEKEATAFTQLRVQYANAAIRATNQRTDAEIRAAIAARNWAEAERLLQRELAQTAAGTRRAYDLEAQLESVRRRQGGLLAAFRSQLTSLLGPLALVATAIQLLSSVWGRTIEGFKQAAALDLQRRQVAGLVNSVNLGNEAFASAIRFGQQYGFTMKEMGEAAGDAAILLQTTTSSAETMFGVLARLQARAPGKTFNDAVRAVAELQAGQVQSIQRIFNVPTTFTARLTKEIEAGRDPIEALDEALDDLGISSAVVAERMEGTAGAMNRMRLANERLWVTVGEAASGPGTALLNVLATATNSISDLIAATMSLNTAVPTIQEYIEAYNLMIETARKPANVTGSPLDVIITGLGTFMGATKLAEDRAKQSNDNIAFSYEKLRKQVEEVTPALDRLLKGGSTGPQTGGLDKIVATGQRADNIFNSLINRFNQGQISAHKLAQEMDAVRGALKGGDDTLGVVAAVRSQFPDAQARAEELQTALVALQSLLGRAPNEEYATALRAQIHAVSVELAHLQSQMPIELTLEMKLERMGNVNTALQAIANEAKSLNQDLLQLDEEYNNDLAALQAERLQNERDYWGERTKMAVDHLRERVRAEEDFNRQQVRALRDFTQQQARAARDFNRQLERGARDFARSTERAFRDFNRSEARAEEDHQRSIADMKDKARQQDVNAERDHRKKLQRLQRDFDIDDQRAREDHEEERLQLLAGGRIFEAQLLQKEFDKERRRAQEDLARDKSDQTDEFTGGIKDRESALEESIRSAQEQFERQRQRRREDFELQRQDAEEAYAQQIADAKEAYAQQQADAKAAYDQQVADAKEAFDRQQADRDAAYREQLRTLDNQHTQEQRKTDDQIAALHRKYDADIADRTKKYNEFYDEQTRKLDEAAKEQEEILRLKAQGFSDQEAAAIAALQTGLNEFTRITTESQRVAGLNGFAAGMTYIEEMARAMQQGALAAKQGGAPISAPIPQTGGGTGGGSFGGDSAGFFVPGSRVGDGFTAPRPGTTGMHYGVDVQAKEGTKILSPVDGVVVRVGTISGQPWAGMSVEIEDKYGRQWYFGHVKWPLVRVGQPVRKGTQIATISSDAHVHVQLRPGKGVTPIDPTPVLEAIAAGGTGAPGAPWAGANSVGRGSGPMDANSVPVSAIGANIPVERNNVVSMQGYDDGKTYAQSFIAGMQNASAQTEALRLQSEFTTTQAAYNLNSVPAAVSPAVASAQPIVIQLRLNNIVLDGQTVGRVIAPEVVEYLSEGADIAVQIVDAQPTSNQQAVFRSGVHASG